MSDFLGRIAARAVGAPALARPRLPVSLAGAAAAGPEVVDEEVVVQGAPPRAREQPSGEPGPAEPRGRPGATSLPASPVEPPPTVAPAPAAPGPAAGLPRQERLVPALEPVLAMGPGAEPDASPADPPATVAVTAVPPTPATPAAPVLAVPAGAAAPAVMAARDEPPPVRVHIGRLEVRASLPEAPRPQPLPEASEPERLSLSDYLRGRRGA